MGCCSDIVWSKLIHVFSHQENQVFNMVLGSTLISKDLCGFHFITEVPQAGLHWSERRNGLNIQGTSITTSTLFFYTNPNFFHSSIQHEDA